MKGKSQQPKKEKKKDSKHQSISKDVKSIKNDLGYRNKFQRHKIEGMWNKDKGVTVFVIMLPNIMKLKYPDFFENYF